MAVINMRWNGVDKTGSTLSGESYKSASGGFIAMADYSEIWNGSSLAYADANSPYPTGGTLTSWIMTKPTGRLDVRISDMHYTIPSGASYKTIITGMLAGKDEWNGDAGNNFFYMSVGGDTYHGGGGIDTVDSLDLSLSELMITVNLKQGSGHTQVATVGGISLTLDSVERIRFSDISIAADVDGNAGEAVKILGAVFGKTLAQDPVLIGIALSLLDAGLGATAVAKAALDARLGDSHGPADLVNVLYTNVFGSAPSAADLQFYGNMVSSGAITPEALTLAAADLALNAANIGLAGLAATGIDYVPFAG